MADLDSLPPVLETPADSPESLRPVARRRVKRGSSRRWLWVAGGVAVAGVAGLFAIQAAVRSYLRSPAFAQKINEAAGKALHAQCSLEGMNWQDSTAHAAQFQAHGLQGAGFRELTLSDARAEVDVGALWDRTWRVKRISVARVEADFSPGPRIQDPVPAGEPDGEPSGQKASWLSRWLPNRTEMGGVVVDRFDFHWQGASAKISGEQIGLTLTPNLDQAYTAVIGSGGTVKKTGSPHILTVRSLQATLRADGVRLDQFEGKIANASVAAEGTLGLEKDGDLAMRVTVDQAQLADWIPDDWLKRCSGVASVDARVRGSGPGFAKYSAQGKIRLKDSLIQALPLLDVIAKKTRNETFLRLQLKEAESDFSRLTEGGWRFEKLRADAPGLLRLKGSAAADGTGTLVGDMLLGIVPGTLRYLAGAEQTVFLPMDRADLPPDVRSLLASDDSGLLWTRLRLGGTLDRPSEDLSDRLARAWFNATADEVANLSMEAAGKAAETAAGVANRLLDAAPPVLPPVLDQAPGILKEGVKGVDQGVRGGLKLLDGLLPSSR